MTLRQVVYVSGGKDSTATYLRAIERGLQYDAFLSAADAFGTSCSQMGTCE